jgi:8-oxo-dGTP pyrophosphatase MutT (NUDIX family)
MVFVIRDKKILMEKIFYNNRFFYTIPGGGIEEGETPEEAAMRELKEECGLEGTIAKKLTEVFKSDGSTEYVFEVNVPEHQSPIVGFDPEELEDNQPIKDVCWMGLEQLSEKDRAFMWSYGLMEIDGFFDEILRWGDSISYPLYH